MKTRHTAILTGVLLILLMLSQQEMDAENGTDPLSILPDTEMFHTSTFATHSDNSVETLVLKSVVQMGGGR